jgi:HprK-related kinase B
LPPQNPTLEHLAAALRGDNYFPYSLGLRLGDCGLRLDTNSEALVVKLRGYFHDFVEAAGAADIVVQALDAPTPTVDLPLSIKPPDPGKAKVKEEFHDLPRGRLVRKRLTGMHFLFDHQRNLAVGPCLLNDNQVINFINSRYIQWMLNQGHLLCHCAAVTGPNGGLALAGLSGRGKSTLALHLVSRGLNFVSNDRLLVRRDHDEVSMHGVAKLPRINPGTALNNPHLLGVMPERERREFAALPAHELWRLEHKYDAYLERCYGPGRFELAATMRGLVILSWRHGDEPFVLRRVDLRQRPDLLAAVMKSPGLFFLPPAGHDLDHSDEAYLGTLGDCPVYELAGGADFQAASLACLDLLSASPSAAGCPGVRSVSVSAVP